MLPQDEITISDRITAIELVDCTPLPPSAVLRCAPVESECVPVAEGLVPLQVGADPVPD